MPMYQGRDDPYSVLPRSEALLGGEDQETRRLSGVLHQQAETHSPGSSWARWTSNGMGDVQLEVRYELYTATAGASGRAVAAAWLDDRIAHAEEHFVKVVEVPRLGDAAVETWTVAGYEVSVRSGNATVHLTYGAYGVRSGTDEQKQLQRTARRVAALAVEEIEEANARTS
ncbi:hypothetical protein ACFY3O_13830 [Streptomyces sp. NPDC001046]|uniref:hypothetical protein n=1 Tax=Streptomyces sp. NPDC001046 TaxID=3364543 RepID=UPI0036D1B8CC